MKFAQLQRRVQRAENLLEGRERQVLGCWEKLKQAWRQGWTPPRIVAAGLVSGFLTGRAEPLSALNGPRALQMIGAVSGLFASARRAAEEMFNAATEDAAGAAPTAGAGDTAAPAPAATQATAAAPVSAPRPAEAATELSEH